MAELNDLEVVDASNTARFPENQAPSTVNDGARALEGILARGLKDTIASNLTTAGTANAQTIAANQTISAYYAGLTVTAKIGSGLTNTTTMTLSVDGVSADTVKLTGGQALVGGEVVAAGYATFVHDGTSTWFLISGGSTDLPFVSSAAITAATTLVVTGMEAGYDYDIQLDAFAPTDDAEVLFMRFSDDDGATYEAGAADYAWGCDQSGVTARDMSDSEIELSAGAGVGNDANNTMSITVNLLNPNVASERTTAMWRGYVQSTTATVDILTLNGSAFFLQGTDAISAVQFLWSGGSTFKAQGDITVYRRRRS